MISEGTLLVRCALHQSEQIKANLFITAKLRNRRVLGKSIEMILEKFPD